MALFPNCRWETRKRQMAEVGLCGFWKQPPLHRFVQMPALRKPGRSCPTFLPVEKGDYLSQSQAASIWGGFGALP